MRSLGRRTIGGVGVVAAMIAAGACASLPARTSGPLYLMASATDLDTIGGFATLPVHRGVVRGHVVWYIVTESSDRDDAARRGVTWSPRLKALALTSAAQHARATGRTGPVTGILEFDSGVDFSPERMLAANPDSGFPPVAATPGSLADPFYTPFVIVDGGTVLNAPIIGDEHSTLDRVVQLNPSAGTVRLRLSRGYADGNTVWYTSTEASDPVVATMERATFAPALRSVPGEGMTAANGSARTGILAVMNGETGTDNAERQGLRSMIQDDRAPLNILEHFPDATGRNPVYSPAWDLHLVRWTPDAIQKNQRGKIFAWPEARALLATGAIVAEGPGAPVGGAPALRPARVVINCPVIAVFRRRSS